MAQSKMWDGNTFKSPYFPARCQMIQSRKIRLKGGNDPRLWLPRVGGRAGRSRPLAVESGAQQDRNQISSVSRTDRIQICARSIGGLDEQVQDRERHQSYYPREVASNHR